MDSKTLAEKDAEFISSIIKKDLDEWLNEVDYSSLTDGSYVPSAFALIFLNFIKLVNGVEGESNKTPPVHLKLLDKVVGDSDYIVNLCFRGAAKTTLFFEYFILFLAFYGYLPNFGEIDYLIYVSDSMENGVKSARKNVEFRYENSEFLKEWVPYAHFTDNFIEFRNKDGKKLACRMFGAKTGIRGTKLFGKRPVMAILDDLISDDDANSRVQMQAIKDTVYKGVDYALDPNRRKVIFNGTPFAKDDIMIEAVESGAWDVNVWPVCEQFPCSREEFRGAWEDRFDYDIREYSRKALLEYKSAYNFYITTDFATSENQSADFSVISVWAYNAQGDWFWVDGVCERQTMDKSVNDLFRLVQEYRPQSVGIEVTGQQGAFIKWLQGEMMNRNVWFNFASSEKSGAPGIRPVVNKLTRFNLVVPLFKAGKMYFPAEMKASKIMGHFYSQMKLATHNGLKGKDDCIDTISMLMYLNAWKPSADQVKNPSIGHNGGPVWDEDEH